MVTVTFLKAHTFNGSNYTPGQIAHIDQKWALYFLEKNIVRITHKKDADKMLRTKADD